MFFVRISFFEGSNFKAKFPPPSQRIPNSHSKLLSQQTTKMFSPTIDFSALSHRGIPTKHNNPFTDMPDGNELVEDWDFGLEETYQSGNLQKNESEGVLIDVCDDDDKEDRDVEGLIEVTFIYSLI